MWSFKKSVVLSSIFTKVILCLILVMLFFVPRFVGGYIYYAQKSTEIKLPLIICIYACCVLAAVAMLCLDRLLCNIKREEVFINQNVFCMRLISWCCFAVSAILLVSAYYLILFILISIAVGFFGMIMRVLKNVFEQAVILKAENELTI